MPLSLHTEHAGVWLPQGEHGGGGEVQRPLRGAVGAVGAGNRQAGAGARGGGGARAAAAASEAAEAAERLCMADQAAALTLMHGA